MGRISDVFEVRNGMEGIGDMLRIAFVLISLAVLTTCFYFYGVSEERSRFRIEAVERGVSEYSSKTGEWQWKDAR